MSPGATRITSYHARLRCPQRLLFNQLGQQLVGSTTGLTVTDQLHWLILLEAHLVERPGTGPSCDIRDPQQHRVACSPQMPWHNRLKLLEGKSHHCCSLTPHPAGYKGPHSWRPMIQCIMERKKVYGISCSCSPLRYLRMFLTLFLIVQPLANVFGDF